MESYKMLLKTYTIFERCRGPGLKVKPMWIHLIPAILAEGSGLCRTLYMENSATTHLICDPSKHFQWSSVSRFMALSFRVGPSYDTSASQSQTLIVRCGFSRLAAVISSRPCLAY